MSTRDLIADSIRAMLGSGSGESPRSDDGPRNNSPEPGPSTALVPVPTDHMPVAPAVPLGDVPAPHSPPTSPGRPKFNRWLQKFISDLTKGGSTLAVVLANMVLGYDHRGVPDARITPRDQMRAANMLLTYLGAKPAVRVQGQVAHAHLHAGVGEGPAETLAQGELDLTQVKGLTTDELRVAQSVFAQIIASARSTGEPAAPGRTGAFDAIDAEYGPADPPGDEPGGGREG